MKRLIALTLTIFAAAAAYGQKGPIDELGFHADKLYDFSSVDSVNLFNGNLIVSIPVGPRYSVGSNLSYQFMLVFNGKTYDEEYWCEDPFNTGCTGINIKYRSYPNLGSNAGNGWRLSLGRLLPPVYTGKYNDSLDDTSWVYEGPAGDEHALGFGNSTSVNAHDGIRMRIDSPTVREIEFGSGEVHTFELENAVWRLKWMRDRFDNYVYISYTYSADGRQEQSWTITDSASRSHTVQLQNYSAMSEGWSRGQMVTQLTLQGYNGAPAVYSLGYSPSPANFAILTSLTQPDGTQYTFSGSLDKIRYPTGGTVAYEYAYYTFSPQDSICSNPIAINAVTKRTVSDGATSREWLYGQQLGPLVPVTTDLYPPCTDDGSRYGPNYWTRTSVLSPLDATNHRSRTDHYFSVFADAASGTSSAFHVTTPLPGAGIQKYGHPGSIGVPPADNRKNLTGYVADVDARDDPADTAARLLATETFANCASNGDCTSGTRLRSTYERYAGDVFPRRQTDRAYDDTRLLSSRTVFNDDGSCGTQQAPETCYTQVTNSDDNGAMQFRTSELRSNFPGAHVVTTSTQFPQWSSAQLTDTTNTTWLLNTYTEKTKTENGDTAREQFCFDGTTGSLKRHRVLGGATPLPNDVVQVFTTDSHGNVQFVSDFGGDVQASIGQDASLCSASLPATPWYKVENSYVSLGHYTGGVLASSRYYDRDTNVPLNFFSVDRDIDYSTGVVKAARDTAGLQTSYDYTPKPARLESVTAPNGAITNYTYTDATGSADGVWTPAKVQAIATSGTQSMNTLYFFDGLGRNMRTATLGPQNVWSATETKYDEGGHVASKSAPESTGANPPSGPLAAAHTTEYVNDAFGRPVSVKTPDGKITSMTYNGVRLRSSTASVATTMSESSVTKTEEYDHSGRLRSITEAVGPNQIMTSYTYDVADHLTFVSSSAGSQTRTFSYPDHRGFLASETHPELGTDGNGTVRYGSYDPHGLAGRKTTGADNGLNDLLLKYDSVGRVIDVYDHNSLLHPLKHFVFDNSPSASDYRRGKLIDATRYNHPSTGDILVTESYSYGNTFGRPSKRDTAVKTANGTVLQSFIQNFSYDPFGALGQIDYPTCSGNAGCGGSPVAPVTYTRDKGLLVGVTNYASSITYNPDNSVLSVTHATTSPVTDTYTQDSSGMSRPGMITFTGLQSCSASAALSGGGTITAGSGQTAPITTTFIGTAPWTVTWSDNVTQSNITQNPFTRFVSPAMSTNYTIASATDGTGCTAGKSGSAYVTVQSSCSASATLSGGGTITTGSGQTAHIITTFAGTAPWTVTWSDGVTLSNVTQNPFTRFVAPTVTTTYTISNVTDATGCAGTTGGTASVTVQSCSASATVSGGGTITTGSGQTAQVIATFGGTAPWNVIWSDNFQQFGITQNPVTRLVSPTATTTYTVTSMTDGTGCSGITGGSAMVTVQGCGASATVSGGGSINIGQSSQIQAALAGASPWSVTWSDGVSQSGITQNPYIRTVTPGATTTYTITSVTDGTGCSGTQSGSATVSVTGLAAPAGFVATTITGNSLNVSISWNPVQGAAWYQVERASRITLNDWQPVNGHLTATATVNTLGANATPVTYLYRVRSGITISGTDYPSPPSALDYATVATVLFTNDPIQAGGTIISGLHMGELRHAVDAVRYAAGFNTPVWSSYAAATGPILAADNTTARQRLDEAVVILVNHGVSYSGETPALNGRIWAYQYQQIREGVK